jgi:hypothetical protein
MDCSRLRRFPLRLLGLWIFEARQRTARDRELRATLKTAAAHLRETKKQESPRSLRRQTYPELRAREAEEAARAIETLAHP